MTTSTEGRRNRTYGAITERLFVGWVKERFGWPARRRLSGDGLQGPDDIEGVPYITCEVRGRKGFNLAGYLIEARQETRPGHRVAIVMRPPGVPNPADWGVLMRAEDFFRLDRELEVEKMR